MPGVQAVWGEGEGVTPKDTRAALPAIPKHLQFHLARGRHAMDVQRHPNVSWQRSLAPSFQHHLFILTSHLGDALAQSELEISTSTRPSPRSPHQCGGSMVVCAKLTMD